MVIGLVAHGQPLLPLLFPGLVIYWGGPQGAVSHWAIVLSTLQSVLKLYQPAHKASSPGGISRSAGGGCGSESFGSLGGEKRRRRPHRRYRGNKPKGEGSAPPKPEP